MPIQLTSDAEFIDLSWLLSECSKRLTNAHMAYAEQRMEAEHLTDTYLIRNYMISLLATLEDGECYGMLVGEEGQHICQSMRHFEQAACALLAAIHMQDDVRGALETKAA